jgi:hypothetical protein
MSFIAKYKSPVNEASVIKNVPMEHLVKARQEVRDAFPGRRIIARFRGPRYDAMRQTTLKRHARAFSVYFD